MEINKINLKPALTCSEEDLVKDIAERLKQDNARRIFVVDSENNLKGIITTTDIVYKAVADNQLNKTAKEIMSSSVEAIEIDDNLEKALTIMNKHNSFICPVLENKKLKGVISYHEIMDFIISNLKK